MVKILVRCTNCAIDQQGLLIQIVHGSTHGMEESYLGYIHHATYVVFSSRNFPHQPTYIAQSILKKSTVHQLHDEQLDWIITQRLYLFF